MEFVVRELEQGKIIGVEVAGFVITPADLSVICDSLEKEKVSSLKKLILQNCHINTFDARRQVERLFSLLSSQENSILGEETCLLEELDFSMNGFVFESEGNTLFASLVKLVEKSKQSIQILKIGGLRRQEEVLVSSYRAFLDPSFGTIPDHIFANQFPNSKLLVSLLSPEFSSLRELNLEGCKIGDEGMLQLAKETLIFDFQKSSRNLRSLNLSYNFISSSGITSAAQIISTRFQEGEGGSLQDLDLSYNLFSNKEAFVALSRIFKILPITSLRLEGNGMGDDGAIGLAEWITSAAKETTANPPNFPFSLTGLEVSNNRIETEGFVALADAVESLTIPLRFLSISDNILPRLNKASQAIARLVKKFQATLENIAIDSMFIGSTNIASIFKEMRECKRLRSIGLGSNELFASDMKEFAQVLMDCCSNNKDEENKSGGIQFLNLRKNKIGVQGAKYIAAALEKHGSSTHTLRLTNTCLCGEGMAALMNGLEKSGGIYSLTTLAAASNSLCDEGIKAIADAVGRTSAAITSSSQRCPLRFIYLNDNFVGNGIGAEAIATILRTCFSTLAEMNVSRNVLEFEGARAIATAMRDVVATSDRAFSNLRKLNVTSDGIGSNGVNLIANALRECRNCCLLELRQDSDKIDADGMATFFASNSEPATAAAPTTTNSSEQATTIASPASPASPSLSPASPHLRFSPSLHFLVNIRLLILDSVEWSSSELRVFAEYLTAAERKRGRPLSGLEIFRFTNNPIGNEGCEFLAQAIKSIGSGLTELDVQNNAIGDVGISDIAKALRACRAPLRILNVRQNALGPNGMDMLLSILAGSENDALQLVSLRAGVNALGSSGVAKWGQSLAKIGRKLETFGIAENLISQEGAKSLHDILVADPNLRPPLKTLFLQKNELNSAAAAYISNSFIKLAGSALTSLRLSDNKITSGGVKVLAETLAAVKPPLASLFLNKNEFGDEGAQELAKGYFSAFASEDAPTLSSLTTLTELDLSRCKIGAVGAKALGEGLKSVSGCLKYLFLEYNRIGTDGIKAMASSFFPKACALVEVRLAATAIGADGLRSLAFAFAKSKPHLQILGLENCGIGNIGIQSISDYIISNKGDSAGCWASLEKLVLQNNKLIETEGVSFLADSYASNDPDDMGALNELNLSDCGLNKTVSTPLVKLLKRNPHFSYLYLFSNKIGDEAAHLIFSAIGEYCRQMKIVDVYNCELTNSSLESLCRHLPVTMQAMDIGENRFDQLPVDFLRFVSVSNLQCDQSGWRNPPSEIFAGGLPAIRTYLRRIAEGTQQYKSIRLMLVGLGEVGKTSLKKAIMSSDNKAGRIRVDDRTEGIDIDHWFPDAPSQSSAPSSPTTSATTDSLQVAIWDFAGQDVYYVGHQLFLSHRCVYVLVWKPNPTSFSLDSVEHMIGTWLRTIHEQVPGACIYIVGTHADSLEEKERGMFFERIKSVADDLVTELNLATTASVAELEELIKYQTALNEKEDRQKVSDVDENQQQQQQQQQQHQVVQEQQQHQEKDGQKQETESRGHQRPSNTDVKESATSENKASAPNGNNNAGGNNATNGLRSLRHRLRRIVDGNGRPLQLKLTVLPVDLGGFVDSVTGRGISNLRTKLVSEMKNMSFMKDELPSAYGKVFESMMKWWRSEQKKEDDRNRELTAANTATTTKDNDAQQQQQEQQQLRRRIHCTIRDICDNIDLPRWGGANQKSSSNSSSEPEENKKSKLILEAMRFWSSLGTVFMQGDVVFPNPNVLVDAMKPLLHHDVSGRLHRDASSKLMGRASTLTEREELQRFEETAQIKETTLKNVLWGHIDPEAHSALLSALSKVGIITRVGVALERVSAAVEGNPKGLASPPRGSTGYVRVAVWLVPSRLTNSRVVDRLADELECFEGPAGGVRTVWYGMRGRVAGGLFSRVVSKLLTRAGSVSVDEESEGGGAGGEEDAAAAISSASSSMMFSMPVSGNTAILKRHGQQWAAASIRALGIGSGLGEGGEFVEGLGDCRHGLRLQWRGEDPGLLRMASSVIEEVLEGEYGSLGWQCGVSFYDDDADDLYDVKPSTKGGNSSFLHQLESDDENNNTNTVREQFAVGGGGGDFGALGSVAVTALDEQGEDPAGFFQNRKKMTKVVRFKGGIAEALRLNRADVTLGCIVVDGSEEWMTLEQVLRPPPPEIFLSHCWSDGTTVFVRWLKDALQERTGLQVWMDEEQIGDYGEIQPAMRRAIDAAHVAVLCMTPMYMTRPNCQIEVEWALERANNVPAEGSNFGLFCITLHEYLSKGSATWGTYKDISDGGCRNEPMNQRALALLKGVRDQRILVDWSKVQATKSEKRMWDKRAAEELVAELANRIERWVSKERKEKVSQNQEAVILRRKERKLREQKDRALRLEKERQMRDDREWRRRKDLERQEREEWRAEQAKIISDIKKQINDLKTAQEKQLQQQQQQQANAKSGACTIL